jgi:hypothetical protein
VSVKLVLHHPYERGNAFDVSGHGLHGRLTDVAAGSGTLGFNGQGSRVDVTPTADLSRMRQFHVRVRFRQGVDPLFNPKRHNLIEGHLSFALFIEPNQALTATILDSAGTWSGPTTPAGTLPTIGWHVVDYFHDGISRAWIYLNNTLVAQRFDVPGPIRDIGPYGLTIGHWPDPPNPYTLRGEIDEVKLWRDDPEDDTLDRLDPCCLDRKAIDELMHGMLGDGWNAAKLTDLVQDILGLGTEISIAARGGDQARTEELAQLTQRGSTAMADRDVVAFGDAVSDIHGFLATHIPASDLQSYGERALDQVKNSPLYRFMFRDDGEPDLDEEGVRELAEVLCLGGLLPPDDRKPKRPPRKPRPEGDPDTDYPLGDPPPGWEIGGEDSGKEDPPRPPGVDEHTQPDRGPRRPFDHDRFRPTGPSEPPRKPPAGEPRDPKEPR